ncbi:MAG TPA: sulfite exporter TauE/SafE family protein [Gaiellaceae bacterium]|nr:sulfite exporter TauE/SafE family protein [Gaiellaceae bacterium]
MPPTEPDGRTRSRDACDRSSGIFKRLDAFILVAVGLWCFATALAGGLVGLILGNIRLPVVVLAASSPAAGAGANIGISALSALAAAVTHIRAGRIDWRLFAWMAPPSMAGAVIGALVSAKVPANALLIAIGVTLLVFGIDLLRPRRSAGRAPGEKAASPSAVVATGAVIGLLGGFVGLILGALRLPALLRFIGTDAFRAVGTNAAVGFCLGVAGLLGHLTGGVDWTLLGVGAASSIPGSILGARLTGRLDERQLLRAVGFVLLVAGAALVVQGIL